MPDSKPGDEIWRRQLYEGYVSSGQAGEVEQKSAEQLYRPRRAHLNGLIRKLFPQDRNVRILDLGCGHGTALHFLAKAGYTNTVGVDLSAEQIALAHRMGIHQARLGTLDDILAEEGAASADVVLSIAVFEHLTREQLFDTLAKVRTVLKPGGSCILYVPNAEGIFGNRIRYGDLTHELAFTPSSAQQMFRTVGFRRVESFEDKPAVHGLISAARRLIWDVGTLPWRILLAAETGTRRAVLSQNLIIRATL